jgi:transposase-like protein
MKVMFTKTLSRAEESEENEIKSINNEEEAAALSKLPVRQIAGILKIGRNTFQRIK